MKSKTYPVYDVEARRRYTRHIVASRFSSGKSTTLSTHSDCWTFIISGLV